MCNSLKVSRHLIFFLGVMIFQTPWLRAQKKGQWVDGSGEVLLAGHITAEEAKQLARKQARSDAIEKALGVQITAETTLQQFEVMRESGDVMDAGESFSKFIRESRRGMITEEGKWQEETRVARLSDGSEVIKRYASNRFYVVPEEKSADPTFQLQVSLPKLDYRQGEALSFEVQSSQDCYLNVFNLSGNDTLYLMFPNVLEKSNRLTANQPRRIPGLGYSFTAALPAGKKTSLEYLVAVATKDSLAFRSIDIVRPGEGYAQTFKSGLNHVWKWIAEIDADRRVEVITSFKIFE